VEVFLAYFQELGIHPLIGTIRIRGGVFMICFPFMVCFFSISIADRLKSHGISDKIRKIVKIFAEIWGCTPEELLVSFDGFSFGLPPEETKKGLVWDLVSYRSEFFAS